MGQKDERERVHAAFRHDEFNDGAATRISKADQAGAEVQASLQILDQPVGILDIGPVDARLRFTPEPSKEHADRAHKAWPIPNSTLLAHLSRPGTASKQIQQHAATASARRETRRR